MQYIARQPILDSDIKVQGYELLFRGSLEDNFNNKDPDQATMITVDMAVLIGLDDLCHGHSMFLNCTRNLLVEGYPTLFPPELTVVEVLETVEPDEEIVAACKRLKQARYRIALDDFVDTSEWSSLVELADFIKVDFRTTPAETRTELIARYATRTRTLLAEKVETREEFAAALRDGFKLFQGYFFCRPNIIATHHPPALGTNSLWILEALSKRELDFTELEQLIKSEPALYYRLLRYLNSPAFYLQREITSVRHALTLLGESEVRKWLLLMCAVVAGTAHKRALIRSAIERARFAELLSLHLGLQGSAMFMLALLSLMDAILDLPPETIFGQIALPRELRAALRGEANRLHAGHELVLAYVVGDWDRCERLRKKFQVPQRHVRRAYLEALTWAKRLTDGVTETMAAD